MDGQKRSSRADKRANLALKIERSALELSLERGVENVQASDVAAAAGISIRTFYRYFSTLNDVFLAMPKRSLQLVAEDFRSRPRGESLRDAVMAAGRISDTQTAEHEIQHLATLVAKKDPDAWWRVMSLVQATVTEVYSKVIAERLAIQNEDPEHAGMLAAVVLAAINRACQISDPNERPFPNPDDLNDVFDTISRLLGRASGGGGRTLRITATVHIED